MNTRTTARNSETRETQVREEEEWTYEEPNALEIPKPVQNRFESEGMSLRWIRINLKDADDYQNVGKKMAEGWTFVLPEEVPEMATSSIVQENGRYTGTVCRGDLALAKMPTGKYQARSRHFQQKSQQLMQAVNSQLESSNDSRMPISNNSKSSVTRGRVPSFQD